MKFLNFSKGEMIEMYDSIYRDTEKEPWKWVEDFIDDHIVDEELTYIQMYHLSRRLNGTDLHANQNLETLLIGDSPLSQFFKKHKVTFEKSEGHINLFYKGKLQSLDDEFKYRHGNIYYLKSRLGYNSEQDYCVNGFAFRSYLEDNYYFSSLSRGPELVQSIAWLLDIDGMVEDYYKNSKYYCIEYLVPMSEVIFDQSYSPDTNYEKTRELLKLAILRLYEDWVGCSFSCDENLILRLPDDVNMNQEWFVTAKEIM